MKRLHLKNGYHDALIRQVRYSGEEDIHLDVDLCVCCNICPGRATICLYGVRNFAKVQEYLEAARVKNAKHNYIDEIWIITRATPRGYTFGLMTAGDLFVDAQTLHEI